MAQVTSTLLSRGLLLHSVYGTRSGGEGRITLLHAGSWHAKQVPVIFFTRDMTIILYHDYAVPDLGLVSLRSARFRTGQSGQLPGPPQNCFYGGLHKTFLGHGPLGFGIKNT